MQQRLLLAAFMAFPILAFAGVIGGFWLAGSLTHNATVATAGGLLALGVVAFGVGVIVRRLSVNR